MIPVWLFLMNQTLWIAVAALAIWAILAWRRVAFAWRRNFYEARLRSVCMARSSQVEEGETPVPAAFRKAFEDGE